MSLVTLREAVRRTLKEAATDAVDVKCHGGRFDGDEVKRWAVTAPCALVGILGMPAFEYEGGQLVAGVEWGVFIVTKDKNGVKRDEAALALLEQFLSVITPSQRWNDEATHAPENIRATSLYGSRVDTNGLAIWAITWSQKHDINAVDVSTLDDFLTYRSEINLTDDEDADDAELGIDTVTLEGAGGDDE